VFHEPVVRRQNSSQNSGGEQKSARRSKSRTATPVVSPHGIPEGAKSALAQIAASTLHHNDDEVDRDETIEILDIPVVKQRRGREPRVEQVDEILENVLEALPEPKASGQGRGRGRGRRVSTGPISTSESSESSDSAGLAHGEE
jgi:ribonuclease E